MRAARALASAWLGTALAIAAGAWAASPAHAQGVSAPADGASTDRRAADLIRGCAREARAYDVLSKAEGWSVRGEMLYMAMMAAEGRKGWVTYRAGAALEELVAADNPTAQAHAEFFVCILRRRIEQLTVAPTGRSVPAPDKAASPAAKQTGPSASSNPLDGNWKIRLACPSLPDVDYTGRVTDAKINTVSGATALLLTFSLDASGRLQVAGAMGRPALRPVRLSASRNGAAYVGTGFWGESQGCSFTATRTGP